MNNQTNGTKSARDASSSKNQQQQDTEQARKNLAGRAIVEEKRMRELGREFEELGPKDFRLKLHFAFSYLVLRVAKEDAYAATILDQLKTQHAGWVPDRKTLQHYTGPLLGYLRERADAEGEFKVGHLRKHPEDITRVGTEQIKDLATQCRNLTGLDAKYGNNTLKGRKAAPTSKTVASAAPRGETLRKEPETPPTEKQASRAEEKTGNPEASAPGAVAAIPDQKSELGEVTNEEVLRARMRAVDDMLDRLAALRISISNEAIRDMEHCLSKARRMRKSQPGELANEQENLPGLVTGVGKAA